MGAWLTPCPQPSPAGRAACFSREACEKCALGGETSCSGHGGFVAGPSSGLGVGGSNRGITAAICAQLEASVDVLRVVLGPLFRLIGTGWHAAVGSPAAWIPVWQPEVQGYRRHGSSSSPGLCEGRSG